MQQPWETGWEQVDAPAPQSTQVATKVRNGVAYHLWKGADGVETVEKAGQYFRVSPGAFNTIPPESAPGVGGGNDQT